MGRDHLLVLTVLWGLCVRGLCEGEADVYIVTLKEAPAVHYYGEVELEKSGSNSELRYGASGAFTTLNKPRHTTSVAAGNYGIPVIVAGHPFGNASGMAPHAHIDVYKALYKRFGGFAADVVAAIDQAAVDDVDIISLSITPNRRPPGLATFFNPIDMALLAAVKAGIFVVQAAGNTGPSRKSMSSFSPWIFTVGASAHDRIYSNYVVLGNNLTIPGIGLASGTDADSMYTLISAPHALKNDSTDVTDLSLGECQDSSHLNQDLIKGKLLICSYSVRFVLGLFSIRQALDTSANVSAASVIFYMDPSATGLHLNPTPMYIAGLIIPSSDDSK